MSPVGPVSPDRAPAKAGARNPERLACNPEFPPSREHGDPASGLIARIALPHILILALLLRLAAMAIPAIAYPDELFQYLEPAHRLVFGIGVTTWEWRNGMRGWLIPLLLAVPMRLGDALAPGTAAYLVLTKVLLVMVSLAPVAAGWSLGARLSRLHGACAAAAAAIWYEAVYFAPHAMSETLASAAILPAAALLLDGERRTARRLAAAGALLGLAAALRFQYLPAIAVLALCGLRGAARRDRASLLLGGIAGLMPSALADAAMGQLPFAWVAENVRQNLVAGQAAHFGTSSVAGFVADNWTRWGVWIVPALWLAASGARRYPALAWMAATNLAFHMALAHKEYRFVLLSGAILVLLAAIGTVDMARADATGRRLRLAAALWLLASLMLGAGSFRGQWSKFRPQLDPVIALRQDPALCGLAVYAHDYSTTGGYTYLHRAVPMLYIGTEEAGELPARLRGEAGRVNTVMAEPARAGEMPAGFAALTCGSGGADRMCLYRRPGGCDPSPSRYAIDRSLVRIGL